MLGNFSRPFASIRVGALPLNTPHYSTLGHYFPPRIVGEPQLEVNRKTHPISSLGGIGCAAATTWKVVRRSRRDRASAHRHIPSEFSAILRATFPSFPPTFFNASWAPPPLARATDWKTRSSRGPRALPSRL